MSKPGPKPETPATKQARGTFRPVRDGSKCEIVVPPALPMQPPWLTEAGQQEWLDNIGRVAAGRIVAEADSALFGTFCNLMGALAQAWQSGAVPPAAHLVEARRLAELFGLAGAKSRVGMSPPGPPAGNPFLRPRPPEDRA